MRYLQSFQTSGAVQDALNAEDLGKPYVALVNNDLDWNSLSPVVPYIGVWSEEQGIYSFQVLDDEGFSSGTVTIGQLNDVYVEGGLFNAAIKLSYQQGDNTYTMVFDVPQASEPIEHIFDLNDSETFAWTTGVSTVDGDSDAEINVNIFSLENKIFGIANSSADYPVNITTINPTGPDA